MFIKKDWLKATRTILVLIITAGIFYVIFKKIDFHSVAGVLANSNKAYLLVAIIFSLAVVLIVAKRWQMILKSMDFRISFKEALHIIMGVYPFAAITPSISSDVIRAVPLRDRIRASKTVGSVLTERILDFSTLCLFLIIGITLERKFEFIGIALFLLSGIVLVFCIPHVRFNLPFKQTWNERLQNIFFPMREITKNKRFFSTVIIYSLLIWILTVIQTMILFYAVGIEISFLPTLANIPLAIIIGQIPITLGGAGTRDAAIIFLFLEYASPSQLLGVGILFSFFRCWLLSIIGIPFMRKMINSTSNKKEVIQ